MQNEEIKSVGKYAASLSLIEIGLGSLLHAASIPLAGQVLSINQIAILSRASFQLKSRNVSLKISLISSLLKSLSPAGKKLTPMLAILMQGFLYSVGVTLFGVNTVGLLMATILSSAWAFIQPLIMLYLLFGKDLLEVLKYFQKEFSFLSHIEPSLIVKIVILTFALKVIVAYVVSRYLVKMSEKEFEKFQLKLTVQAKPKQKKYSSNQLFNAFMDLSQPLFIISYILTAIFLYDTRTDNVSIVWTLLRPITIGVLIFYLVRICPMENVVEFLEKRGMKSLSQSLKVAIETIKRDRDI